VTKTTRLLAALTLALPALSTSFLAGCDSSDGPSVPAGASTSAPRAEAGQEAQLKGRPLQKKRVAKTGGAMEP